MVNEIDIQDIPLAVLSCFLCSIFVIPEDVAIYIYELAYRWCLLIIYDRFKFSISIYRNSDDVIILDT